MARHTCRRGGARLAVVVVVLVIGAGLVVLMPAIQRSREESRRLACMRNLEQWGKAIARYESAHRRLPMASTVTRDDEGRIAAVDGWSFRVPLLPYLDDAPHCAGHRPRPAAGRAGRRRRNAACRCTEDFVSAPPLPELSWKSVCRSRDELAGDQQLQGNGRYAPREPQRGVAAAVAAEVRPAKRHPDGRSFPGTALTERHSRRHR